MSSRRSKKNQKFGSSRRVNRGLRVDEEKDNEFDGQDEVHTTSPSDDTVLEARFDHPPSLKTDNQTTALECSPHAESPIHKDSYVEAELPERKRKIGSTRKKVGGFNSGRNLEPCDEVRTTEEFGEEQETQLNTSTTEEHTYPTKDEHRNASSDLWQQTQRSGSGGELGVAQNIMVTVSQSKETDAIHHQEISSYSQISSLEAGRNMAMEQSTAQSNVVAMAKTDHKTLLASTSPKRKMGMTRRPLGGNREQNRENVAVQELLRNTTDDVWKAEVKSSEAEFSMLEEMMQTWDDVKRIIPTNTSSHTESPFVSNQPLSSERTEELDVSAETETNNQSVACSVVDPAKPPSDRFNNHETIFLNKEIICYKLGLETEYHAEDCNVFQNVTDSPPTRSENVLIDVGGCSDTYQDVPDSRHNTSEDCGSVKLVETKEEPCRSDPKIIISSSKQDTEIDKLVVNVEEPLSSLCPLDVATKDGNFEISTDVLTAEVSRISETLESDITHAEPATVESTLEMTDPGPGSHGLEDEEKETLKESSTSGQEMKMEEEYTQSKELEHKEENMNIQATDDFVEQEMQSEVQQGKTRNGLEKHSANETNISDSSLCSANCNLANVSPVTERLQNVNMNLSSLLPEDSKLSCDVMIETMVCSRFNDLIINNEDSLAIVPEAENREIYVEIKEGNDIDVIERSITCDVTVTEIVMDVENLTEQSVDPQTLAARENENVGTKTGPETDALEIKDQDNVENNAKDDIIMQILKDERENEEEEGDTKDQEQQPASQIQGRPSRVDPDKESYDFIRDASVENAEESLLNAKSESAFDGEDKTCEKYKIIEESGGKRKLDESAVTILDVTDTLSNIPDNDIRSDLQMEKHSSDIHFDALMQDAATESSSAVSEQTEISIIPEDSQGVQTKDGDSEGLAEKDKGPEFPEQNNVIDQNIKQTMMIVKDDEHFMTETVRKSTQELCEDEPNKAEGHAEITSEQQLRSSLNISQKQDGPPQDDSENMLEIEAEEMFLRANTVHGAFERMIQTNDQSKKIEEDFIETEVAEHLTNVNIQDNANQSDLQTENPELKKVLTGGQNNTNLEELQESEHAKNVSAVTDSGLSFEDSGESHKELENINEIPKDSQKEEKQSKIKPLVHKRKIKGNKGQRKDREQDDESETLNNEEKEQEREISGEKETGPVEVLDSTIIQSSCNAEKSTGESISDITESQTTTKSQAESQETAGDNESLPVGGDTEAHLEIQTDIEIFYSKTTEEGTEENICDDDVLKRQAEFVGDKLTVESNMTIESDLLQNNTSLDTNQEALKSSEIAQNVSAVTDSDLPLKDCVLVGSGEKTKMSIISDNSQGDSPSKLNPLAHKRKMGSTRRPLRGNKEKIKSAEEKEDEGSEGVAEEDTDLHSETQEQNKVIDDNIIQTIDVSDNEEHEMTETVRKSTQELCDDAADKAEGHAEITSEQQLRSSSNIWQTQDGSPQDDSENMLESEMDVREEKDEETENTVNNIEATKSEEIFAFEDINSEVTVTPQTQNQLFIQTTDEDVHDYIQTVKDVYEESGGDEMFLSTNTDAAFDSKNETKDESKETEDLEEITNLIIQDNDSQLDLQTENTKQNKVLTEEQNTNATLHINLAERQETEHAENVFVVSNSGLLLGDSGESHKELENVSEIPEDSQNEEKQSKIKPLVHKRKMGSTRRPLRGNKGQRKDREQDDESETLNNEEKEQEREISGDKDTGPVEEMDSTIIQSSCNAEKSTEESISDITESQTTTKCQAESQETAGDVESLPVGGDTEAHLEIQTDIKMFDSTIIEGTEENICDDDVLMRQDVFFRDTVTVESNMTIESDLLQNNTSLDTHQEALKSSENVESVFAGTDSGLLLKDVVLIGSGETEAVSEKTEISITSENSQRDSSSTLNPLAHKRKMGSTRRQLRGNKGQRKDREQDDESETLNNEEKEQEREISGEKDTGPVEVLDSTIIQSSCNAEKSTEESISDITESQTTTKSQAESQETAGDVESLPVGGDTEAHLEIQTDIEIFYSKTTEEGTEENICDDDVLKRQAEFVGDKLTVESNMTIESDLLQNNTSLDTNQEPLKSSEIAQNVSAVTDSDLPLKDCVLVGSGEKTKMSIISDNSQGDSPSKLNPLAHKRKMGSTRRPLRGNKEKIKSAEEKEDEGSEGVAEEDTDLHSETQEQNKVIDDNIIQTIDVSDNEEHEMTETVRKSTQELCDDAADKAEGHAEITSEQQLRSSSNIWQTQDGSPQDDSENMLESEMDVREEKDEETENTVNNIEATKSEEIFAFEDINSEVTVTPQTQNQLFIQTTDEDVHDYIQTVKDVYEESGGDEMFLSTNTDAAFDSKNETKDESKETEDLEEITNLIIQDNDSQLDLQTENTKQNKVLTEEQNTNATLHINLAERQETEHAENVFAVTNSGLSLGDSGESHKELENVSEIPEDSQNEEKQSKIKPLVHKRKMGSTRRPLRGNKGQRKDREQDDESETLNNEEKEQEREISGDKDTGPVEEMDSTIIQSSCNAEKSTEESISDITESQTTTKCQAESQETAGDVESLPVGGDTEAHLEIQTDIKMFDSTIIEGTEENICDDDVLMRQDVFFRDTVTVESNMTIESDLLQNNTSLDTHQEALKSSENVESVFAGTDSGLLLKDVVLIGSGETEAVSEKTEISITSENSQRDSSSTLNPLAHKRKMGSTRRQLRGNKGQRKDREQDDESETLNNEEKEQEREISGEKDTGPVEVLDSTIIQSSCNAEKSTEESISDITESQTTTKSQAESQETAGDVESLPVGGDTEAHLEIQTDIEIFYSKTIEEGTEENICDDDVLMRQAEFVGDKLTAESNMTIESDLLQNNTSLDTNQEPLKSSEIAQNVSAVTDSDLPLKDCVLVGSGEKTEMSIISDNSQGDSPSKLNPLAHKRKMGSTRRPLRGNKEKIKSAEEKEDEGSEGVAEEDTDLHSETQEQNNVIDDNIIQTIDVSDNEEHEMTETVRKSTQELCDDAADKAEGHAEITSEQQLRSSSNIWQTQDCSPQDDSENMLESEMDVREEKDEETENTVNNIEATKSEEIFAFEDINSEVTVTPQTQNQLFIQTTDEDVHDYIQTVKYVYEESGGDEMFLSTNTDAAFDSKNETKDESKETEDLEEITNLIIQDNDSQLDLQTENTKQNKVLTEEQNTNATLHINLAERQETEHAENVFAVTNSGLSLGDSGESHKKLENVSEIPEDSQNEEKQSKIKPLVHKRKMGSTRRPLRGNKGQRKDREQDDESETLNNEEKEQEREISGEKDTGPVEEMDSTIIQSSCNAEKSTEESISDITESQTTTKCQAESQETIGDNESLPAGGDTEAHLEIQTDIKIFDSTMNKEGTEENICDDDVLMRHAEFVENTLTVDSNMTIESEFLQNNTSLDTHQEALKSSENVESVFAGTDSGLLLKDVVLIGSGETEAVSEKTEISITSENSQRDSSSTLNPLAHKRKMGSTRRQLRGNKGQRKDREQDDEYETLKIESLINEEKSTEESICDVTDSQTTTKSQAESQETAGDVESLPVGGDTEAHLEIQTDIKMFDSTIIEGTEENICDDDVLMRHVEFVGDTFTVESNLTIESDFLQNNTSLDTNQEALKSSENAQNVSAVTETGLPLKDCVLVGSVEKTEMSIYPPAHKRKMGSTRRPLRGNKEKIKSAEEKEDEGSKGVAEEDTDLHAETQEQNKVIDDNIIQTIDVSDNEEHEMTETVRKSTQELCDDAADKAEGHAEITSEQQLRSSSNIWQTQDGSPQDDSENMLESEMDVREEKETENTAYDEEIFAFEDINSRETVTPQAQNQLFIQTTDEDIHDYIQTVKDVYEESQGKEMFLSANTNLTIRNNDSRSDLQTENPKQNKVLTEDQNTNSTPQINQEERQETESNVFAVTDSGLSIGDSGESHTKLENISKIPEDSQKIQSKLNPLVHKRKMGSKRRPTRGNKEQRKDREWPEESQKNAGDVASVPVGGDTEAHLEIQTEIKTFDSTVEEGKKDNIYDNDVPMRQAEFVGDKLTVESNMTIESEFLQNNTSLDTNQEALKSSENVEIVSTVIHSGLVLQDVATESSLESNTVPEKTEISIIPEDSHVEDSHLKLNAVVHKRKLGSTRRPLRGNKDKEDLREAKEEDMEPHSEIQEQNNVIDHDTMQKIMDVRHNEEKTLVQELCEHLSENKEWHSDITLEKEQTSSSNISQTQTAPSQDDAYENLPEVQESNTLVLSEALLMEEIQINVSEPVVTVGTPQIGDGKIQSVFSRSVQKRKMGSTRKTQRGQRMEKERELGEELDGETKNATTKEDTIKPQENFILEEVMSLTITGTHAHQQPSSLPSNKEGHDIENNGSKLDNQTENSEQTERQEQNDPNSNTNSLQNHDISEIIIYEKSHTENIQSNMNPTAQKRKMGSTRKTLRGNGRRTREVESKEIDGDSERTSEGHSTEFATIEREPETKLDENPQFKETRNSKGLTHSVTTSKIFFETEDIVGLSVVSEEIQSKAPSEAFSTDLQSEMLVSADEMKVGEKYDDPSELENLDKSKSLEEVESKHQLQTVLDQSHHVVHSEKHPRSETVTPERRRKMGSTRKNVRGNREEKTREESESNQFAPEEDQDGETSIIREAERYQIIHDSFEQSDSSLLSEIERALRKTSPSSQSTDYQLIVNEPNLAKTPIETSHFNTPENSESEQRSDKEKYVSLQVTESQNPSEISSPGRRRKMGSTRKNPRQQLQAKREDEHKEDETEQEPTSLKKDLEAAEESKMHDSRDNEEHKEYLDVPVTLTNSCQTEERTNPAGQEGTSPSTKRKFGSRRTNVGKSYLGGLIPPESNDDLTENTGARLVSLDQMIKASQHAGKKQTADLKNISDMEVVQFNVVMVGNSSVGKTSFVRRFHGGEFSPDYSSTIGVDTCVQNVVFHDKVVKLQIWDTAGQERFHSITTQVFHRADGLFLMYEITSSKSFISVRDWISQIQEKAPDDVIMILLGNKNDCAGREVQVQEGEDLAREYNINFMECSAATGDNVSECMRSLAEMLVQRKRQKMEEHTPLKRERPQKKSGCC